MNDYPPQLEIQPLAEPPRAIVHVPGSKSITDRALVLAALTAPGDHDIILDNPLQCDDTEVMIDCLRKLGWLIAPDWKTNQVRLRRGDGFQTILPNLFVANSGTTMRFLTALVATLYGRYRLDGVPRMRERPIGALLDALTQLGVRAVSQHSNGCPPVAVETTGMRGGTVRIKGDTSSQFLSGLLLAAPFADNEVVIEIDGPLVSVPYVTMTVAIMRDFGLTIEQDGLARFRIPAPQRPVPLPRYVIEPDASAASYFFGVAAVTGGSITVPGLSTKSLQGDVRFVDLLQEMGCRVERNADALTVHGGALHGIDVDMNDISDTVMTLAAVACFAEGPTTIRNVAHIRHKETDRLQALANELRRIGAGVEERADGLTITPAPLRGAVVETYSDHRMAMSMALIGLKVSGIVIDKPACVAKTYPRFFEDLERLR